MSKNPIGQYKVFIKVALVIILASLFFYFLLQNYTYILAFIFEVNHILQPIIYGIVLAYLISPVCRKIEKYFRKTLSERMDQQKADKWAHLLSVGISIVILIFMFLAIIMLIIPQLITSITTFIEKYPENLSMLESRLNEMVRNSDLTEFSEVTDLINEYLGDVVTYLSDTLLPNVNSIINSFSTRVMNLARTLFNLLIGFIVAVYCLDKRKIFGLQFKKILFALLPEKAALYVLERASNANEVFLGFIIGKIIDSIIIGVICFVGVLIIGVPSPVLISVIIGVTNIIPFFGPFLGAIPCTLFILLEAPMKALYFIIFVFILQQFDGNILGPKILGDTTGITSFWVLFSILLFGGLWGVFGMIVAVPLFVVIYNILKELTNERLKQKGLPTTAYSYEDPEELVKNTEAKETEKNDGTKAEA